MIKYIFLSILNAYIYIVMYTICKGPKLDGLKVSCC